METSQQKIPQQVPLSRREGEFNIDDYSPWFTMEFIIHDQPSLEKIRSSFRSKIGSCHLFENNEKQQQQQQQTCLTEPSSSLKGGDGEMKLPQFCGLSQETEIESMFRSMASSIRGQLDPSRWFDLFSAWRPLILPKRPDIIPSSSEVSSSPSAATYSQWMDGLPLSFTYFFIDRKKQTLEMWQKRSSVSVVQVGWFFRETKTVEKSEWVLLCLWQTIPIEFPVCVNLTRRLLSA